MLRGGMLSAQADTDTWVRNSRSGAKNLYLWRRAKSVGAPRTTPTELIEKLNPEINAALANPKIKARLVDLGGTVLAGSPAELGKLIAEDNEKWGKVVKFAGIKPE